MAYRVTVFPLMCMYGFNTTTPYIGTTTTGASQRMSNLTECQFTLKDIEVGVISSLGMKLLYCQVVKY